MFERYSERARCLVFWARHEASQRGSTEIEPSDLFLGATHDTHRPGCPFGQLYESRDTLRALLLPEVPPTAKAEVDVPLSKASKEALVYGAQEADRDTSRAIGIDHLLRGVMRAKDRAVGRAAGAGYTLKALRSASEEAQLLGLATDPAWGECRCGCKQPPPSYCRVAVELRQSDRPEDR